MSMQARTKKPVEERSVNAFDAQSHAHDPLGIPARGAQPALNRRSVLNLQRTQGNQHVLRLMERAKADQQNVEELIEPAFAEQAVLTAQDGCADCPPDAPLAMPVQRAVDDCVDCPADEPLVQAMPIVQRAVDDCVDCPPEEPFTQAMPQVQRVVENDCPDCPPETGSAVQRTAVSDLIQRYSTIDRAGGQAHHIPVSVQRFGLSDITGGLSNAASTVGNVASSAASTVSNAASAVAQLPGGLLNSLTGAANTVQQVVSEATSWGQNVGGQAITDVQQQAEQGQGQAQAAATEAQQADQQAQQGAQQSEAQVTQAGQAVDQHGTNAINQLTGMGPALETLSSPVRAATQPAAVAAAGAQVGNAANTAAPAAAGQAAGMAAQGDPNAAWDCSEASVLSRVGGVAKSALQIAERIPGVGSLVRFGEDMFAKGRTLFNQVSSTVSGLVTSARAFIDEKTRPIQEMARSIEETVVGKYNEIKTAVTTRVDAIKTGISNAWNTGKAFVTNLVTEKANQVRGAISSAVTNAGNLVRNLGSALYALLPDWAKNIVNSLQSGMESAVAGVQSVAQRVGQQLTTLKDQAITAAQNATGAVALQITQGLQAAKRFGQRALQAAGEAGRAAYNLLPASIREPLERAGAWVSEEARAIRAAIGDETAKLKGEVCAVMGEAAGPCIERLIPDPGENNSRSITLSVSGDVTIPLEGFSLKVGQGAKLEIKRSGTNFDVTVSGEATLTIPATSGGGGAHADVTLPGGATVSGSGSAVDKAWGGITGSRTPATSGSAPGGATAPGGAPGGAGAQPGAAGGQPNGAPGGAPAGGEGMKLEGEGGIKGTVSQTYRFDASKGNTNCEGLGGLSGLLASFGLGAALPAPLGNLINMAGQSAFASNLTSVKFTAGAIGEINLAGGPAELKAKLEAMQGVEYRPQGDPDGEKRPSITLSAALSGALEGKLPFPGLSVGGGLAEGSFTMSLVLVHANDMITPSRFVAELKASANLFGFNPGAVGPLLPSGAVATVANKINDLSGRFPHPQYQRGIELTGTYTVTGLDVLTREIAAYAENNQENATGAGVVEIAKRVMQGNQMAFTPSAAVDMNVTRVLAGASVGGNVGEGTEAVGVNVGANVTDKQTFSLYKSS